MSTRPYEQLHKAVLIALLVTCIVFAMALDENPLTNLHAAGWVAWFGAFVSAIGCMFYIILKFPNNMLYYPYFVMGGIILPTFVYFLQ